MSRRLWSSYLTALAAFASLTSGVSAYEFLADGRRFGGDSMILASLLRSSAPMAAGSALLLALVLWIEGLSPARLSLELDRGLKRALSLALPGYVLAVVVCFGSCFALAAALLGLGPRGFGAWLADVTRRDVGAGLAFMLLDTGLILVLARRFGPRLRSTPASLPAKLILVVTVTVPLRAMLALIVAPLLPA